MHLSIFLNEKRQVIKYIAIDFIGYFKTRGSKSPQSLNKVTTSYVDIYPPIISVEKKERQRTRAGQEFHFFLSLLQNVGGKRSNFVEFTCSDIKKMISNTGPESKKKSTNFLLSTRDTKINRRVMN